MAANIVPRQTTSGLDAQIVSDVETLLQSFDGEASLKRLFWEVLSYDRVREPLPTSLIASSAAAVVKEFEVFAESDARTVVYVQTDGTAAGCHLESIAAAARRTVSYCVLIHSDGAAWAVVCPDEAKIPRVRVLPLPGPIDQREETARALVALTAADDNGEPVSRFEQSERLEAFFPGITPNLTDIIDHFERLERHHDPEIRELGWYMHLISEYPLLTAKQERGEDQHRTDGALPDQLELHQQRLVLHNLRLVVWMAMKVRRVGMTLSDLIQEGTIGLMIAANRWEAQRGNRFSTYAFWWIRQTMYRAMHNQCNLVRWPVHTASRLLRAARDGNEDGLKAGQKPVRFLPCSLTRVSIPRCDVMQAHAADSIARAVRQTITHLRPNQQDVIARRFAIGRDEEETLEEIGQSHGLTRERIRQIEAKALKRLSHQHWKKQLRPYVECSEWRLTRLVDVGRIGKHRRPANSGSEEQASQDSGRRAVPQQIDTKQIILDGAVHSIRVFESLDAALAREAGTSTWNDDWRQPRDEDPITPEELDETRQLLGAT